MSTIGQKIKQIMGEKNISQYRLSKLSGVAQSTISAIISEGQTRSPAIDTVERLAKAMNCSVSDIMNNETPVVNDDGLDETLVNLLLDLSPDEVQRVEDFVAGLKASRIK